VQGPAQRLGDQPRADLRRVDQQRLRPPVQTTGLGSAKIEKYTGKESTPPSSGIPDEKAVN